MRCCNVVLWQKRIKAARLQKARMCVPTDEVPMPDPDLIASPPAPDPAEAPVSPDTRTRPKEIGGRDGLDPTRYGDWEKDGRCIDF